MSVVTIEGIVEKGKIRLKESIRLPEKTKVYVVVPDFGSEEIYHIFNPRLLDINQLTDFKMEIIEESQDAKL